MPIDVEKALAADLEPIEFSWTSSDIQLYHLGLGAGADPMDERELRYLTDNTPQVLPTFGNVAVSFHMTEAPTVQFPGGIDIELSKVLHASEGVTVPGPIPTSGKAWSKQRFTEIWDKGKAAVIVSESTVTDESGAVLWTTRRSIFARGEGGFGGGSVDRRRRRSCPTGPPPTPRSPCRRCRSRRCCTGCAVTAIRCIRIRRSPRPPGSIGRSCTGCAPTVSAPRPSSITSSTAMCRRWLPTVPGSPAPSSRVRRCRPISGSRTASSSVC